MTSNHHPTPSIHQYSLAYYDLTGTKETTRHIKTYNFSREDEHDPSLQHEWVQMKPRAWHHLDELFAGSCDGMTYEEIEKAYVFRTMLY
jgi:hypothetical protein